MKSGEQTTNVQCDVFFHLLAAEGNMKIISRNMIQRAEKSYSIDIVVISRHINIAYT